MRRLNITYRIGPAVGGLDSAFDISRLAILFAKRSMTKPNQKATGR